MEECDICFEDRTDFVVFSCKHKVCSICYPNIPRRCPFCNVELPILTVRPVTYPIHCLQIPCFILIVIFSVASFIEYLYH